MHEIISLICGLHRSPRLPLKEDPANGGFRTLRSGDGGKLKSNIVVEFCILFDIAQHFRLPVLSPKQLRGINSDEQVKLADNFS